ncbi:hypothetical protein [Cellulomonas terrae]|uniref:Uncharacterized protein n=1 Tax=Cellulomonas terrae TaxID=311234 RepID=A0A511JIL1_9CELL|nr:hypothetical protein [Cellulomonas terrae]GEL97847.1 hypothetical protein CTE05_13940 [Cellulomonas terrae]
MRSIRGAAAFGGAALVLLLVATIVSGVRSATDGGAAPTVLNLLACGLGIVSALLFLTVPGRPSRGSARLAAGLVGAGAVILLAVWALTTGEPGSGANIGLGLVRLVAIGLLVTGVLVGWGTRGRPAPVADGAAP